MSQGRCRPFEVDLEEFSFEDATRLLQEDWPDRVLVAIGWAFARTGATEQPAARE